MARPRGFEPSVARLRGERPDLTRRRARGSQGRARTCDHLVNSEALYRLSYLGMKWWTVRELNPRPAACKTAALPLS
jgi:hypothetical protein